MIFPDVNLLLYAHDNTSVFHESASAWLVSVLQSEQVFLSWQTISGFLRISTSNRIWSAPLSIDQSTEIVNSWVALDNVHIVNLDKKNWPLFSKMLAEGQAVGNLVMDAHVATMAASCGATVATTDLDFSRFPNLRTINPLKS